MEKSGRKPVENTGVENATTQLSQSKMSNGRRCTVYAYYLGKLFSFPLSERIGNQVAQPILATETCVMACAGPRDAVPSTSYLPYPSH